MSILSQKVSSKIITGNSIEGIASNLAFQTICYANVAVINAVDTEKRIITPYLYIYIRHYFINQ